MCILFTNSNSYKLMFGDSRCDEGRCRGAPGTFLSLSSSMSFLTSLLIIINFIVMMIF